MPKTNKQEVIGHIFNPGLSSFKAPVINTAQYKVTVEPPLILGTVNIQVVYWLCDFAKLKEYTQQQNMYEKITSSAFFKREIGLAR